MVVGTVLDSLFMSEQITFLIYVVQVLLLHCASYVKIPAKLFFMLRGINLCSILRIADDLRPTLAE